MERNTVAFVSDLKIGDRFYKLNDKKKKVWQKSQVSYNGCSAKKDGDLHPTLFNKETQVIFLRHAE